MSHIPHLIGNDSGGAVARIFAANYANRLTSLVLTNCDVHDGWPPPQVLPLMEHARNGTPAPIFQDKKWAYWLKDTIPGARRVVEVEDARLFFAEDRPDALAAPVLEF
jgi:hypothetical protein